MEPSMQDLSTLLDAVRCQPEITNLDTDAARGAEAYIQAYEYIVDGNPGARRRVQRRMAMRYLLITASPPLAPAQVKAAKLARRVIKRLS